MGKFVSEAFKETHQKEWKVGNPTGGDMIELLAFTLRTEARWNKAVQHLRDSGRLEESPRDIGALIEEVKADVEKECREEIRDRLYNHAWPQIRRKIVAGLPQWYKERLLQAQFGKNI